VLFLFSFPSQRIFRLCPKLPTSPRGLFGNPLPIRRRFDNFSPFSPLAAVPFCYANSAVVPSFDPRRSFRPGLAGSRLPVLCPILLCFSPHVVLHWCASAVFLVLLPPLCLSGRAFKSRFPCTLRSPAEGVPLFFFAFARACADCLIQKFRERGRDWTPWRFPLSTFNISGRNGFLCFPSLKLRLLWTLFFSFIELSDISPGSSHE